MILSGSWCTLICMRSGSRLKPIKCDQLSIEERVYLERVKQFFGHSVGNIVGAIIGAVLIAQILNNANAPKANIVIWFCLIIALSVNVAVIEHSFAKSYLSMTNARKWVAVRFISGGLIAFMYGISPFLFTINTSIYHEMLIFIILSAMVSVASTGYSVMPLYYLAVNFLTLFPLTIYFGSKLDHQHTILFVSIIVWQVFVLTKAWRVSKTSINALVLNERLRDEIIMHQQTKQRLHAMATNDSLTELSNRRSLFNRLTTLIKEAHRYTRRFAVIFIDLDDFKRINDAYGHETGDMVLKEVARRLKEQTREVDIIARLGGDEFVIVYMEVDNTRSQTDFIADRIKTTLAKPVNLANGSSQVIGGSIGISLFPEHGVTPESLINAADRAMYRAKEDKYSCFSYAVTK